MNREEFASANESAGAGVRPYGNVGEDAHAAGRYSMHCRDAAGNLKWSEPFDNLVTTQGKNTALDAFLAGSSYTATWFLGLIDAAGFTAVAVGDTMASHAGWTEAVGYGSATRPAVTFTAASAGQKSGVELLYTISGSATIKGAFLSTGSAKSGTAGALYSAGAFAGGDRAVGLGDTLAVTYSASL